MRSSFSSSANSSGVKSEKARSIGWAICGTLLLVDLAYFTANSVKIVQGGWFPLAIAAVVFTGQHDDRVGARQGRMTGRRWGGHSGPGGPRRVIAAGGDPAKVIFSGVGKTRAEMHRALLAGIECFNVESEAELEVLDAVAREVGVRAPVSLRVNPNVDAKTHPYISTGLKGNKFGIAHERAVQVYQHAASLPGLSVVGIDCHIGSQITEVTPYLDAMDRILDLVADIEKAGVPIHHIDFGGGLGIDYNGDTPPAADALWAQLLAKLDARGYGQRQLMIEPGRSLVGNAGVCLTEVVFTKPGEQKNFCIVDAAMNDLPRPAMYEAFHQIVPVSPRAGEAVTYDVVGPVCESGDWLGRDRALNVQTGDVLAVLSAGAYCMSMSSNYNTRGRAAEVLVDVDKVHLIRQRESAFDTFALEQLVG